jgi:hypothetical protein
MDWLRKYKFKNNLKGFLLVDNLLNKNLNNFEYLNEISEEEFIKGKKFLYLKENNIRCWNIGINMVEKDLKKIRKDKLNGLVKKI